MSKELFAEESTGPPSILLPKEISASSPERVGGGFLDDEAVVDEDEEEDFFDSAPICQHVVAPDGTILRANRTELELLGYEESEFVGHNIEEFHTNPALFASNLADLFRGEQLHHREISLRRKEGSVK